MAEPRVLIEDFSDVSALQGAAERRYPVQLFRYWEGIRAGRALAPEGAIEPDAIAHLWDHCYLIQVNDLENRLKVDFTYMGAEILRTYREYLSESDSADIITPRGSRLSQNFSRVILGKKPVLQSGEFKTEVGHILRFRQCLLPIGETDERVEAIFGCARLKLYM